MLLFLALCAGLLAFLHPFALPDNSGPLYLKWESAAILSADGAARPFDPIAGQPELEGGEWFRLRTTLPKARNHGCFLIYELTGAEIAVFLDERELLDSSSRAWEDTLNLSQAEVPLPAGGGETLTMDLRPLSTPMNLFPPMARLTEDPDGQDLITAAASYYALPAGAAALALALLCGLFLLGVAEGRPSGACSCWFRRRPPSPSTPSPPACSATNRPGPGWSCWAGRGCSSCPFWPWRCG